MVLDPGGHGEVVVRSLQEWRKEMSPGSFERLAAVAGARRTGMACYLQQTAPVTAGAARDARHAVAEP